MTETISFGVLKHEDYQHQFEDGEWVGLYQSYGADPPLMNAALLFTVAGFGYEPMTAFSDHKQCMARLNYEVEEALIETVENERISDIRVKSLMSSSTPKKIRSLLTSQSVIQDLSFVKQVQKDNPKIKPKILTEIYNLIIARCALWSMYRRGAVEQKGNVIHVQFQSKKHMNEITDSDLQIMNHYVELFRGINKQ